MSRSARITAALTALVVAVVGVLATFGVINDDGGQAPAPSAAITVPVNQPGNGPAPAAAPDTITVPRSAVQAAAPALEDGLRDETPAEAQQAAPEQLQQLQNTVDDVRANSPPLSTAGASAGFDGCVTRFVRNQSSRGGVRPIWQVLHYTVSPNRPGWDDVNAVVALFDRTSSQASSNFVIDGEGHCAYIVPIEAKAWTQAAGNPLSISYEVINSGSESAYMASPGYTKLKSVMRQVHNRTGIPMRKGSVFPAKSGIVQHKDGGIAWGGHVDITPFNVDQVVKIVTAGAARPAAHDPLQLAHYRNAKYLTAGERQAASCLLAARRAERKAGSWSKTPAGTLARARGCKRTLEDRVGELKSLPPRRGAHRAERRKVLANVVRATG